MDDVTSAKAGRHQAAGASPEPQVETQLEAQIEDNTTPIEADVLRENEGNFRHLWRLFAYVLSSAKAVCAIYISLTVLLRKILSGMLQPSEGILLIDGVPAEEIDPFSRYTAMSAVFQDPARYSTFTVADNVYLGDTGRERDEAEIEAALASAGFEGADRDALLGKDLGGTDLSGGQWQKLAIARGWYRNRSFIILDEPTSNLDPLAEADVFRRYIEMSRDRTVIMVTHRISIASLCDRVVVFKDGKVVEDGTHDSLIDLGGEYARLHAEQSRWYER